MGKMQRNKGQRFEREIAGILRDTLPDCDAKRGWQARSGKDNCDVDIPRLWIECKHGIKPNPRAALQQAIEATDGRLPIAIIKDDYSRDPMVVMRLSDFLLILKDWWQCIVRSETKGRTP